MNRSQCLVCHYSSDYQSDGIWNGWPVYKCSHCGVHYLARKSSRKMTKAVQMVAYYKNSPIALLDRFHILSRQPIIFKMRSGITFLVYAGTHDVQVINEIWIDKIYSPWKGDVQPDWVVVDFGSHRGIFAIYAARVAKMVYAVEANPEVVPFLQLNISVNELSDKVSLLQGAIACTEGVAEYFVAKDAGMSGLVKRESVEVERSVKVAKIPVKQFFEGLSTVNLLKVDIEGAEFDLFAEDCNKEWLNKVERIAMEYHDNPAPICYTLQEFGFRTILWPERNLLYAEHLGVIS